MSNTVFHRPTGHRFAIKEMPSRASDTGVVFMIYDAEWVLDSEVRAGRSAPAVNNTETFREAWQWCDGVAAGAYESVPHESNFEGWPELGERVHQYLLKKQGVKIA